MSGLYSPLLAQAGFAKSKLASVIEWVAEIDGVAQYWQLSKQVGAEANVDFKATCVVILPDTFPTSNSAIFGGGGEFTLYLNPEGSLSAQIPTAEGNFYGLSTTSIENWLGKAVKITVELVGGVFKLYLNQVLEKTYDLSDKTLTSLPILYLGAWQRNLRLAASILSFTYEQDGIITNHIDLTNKSQGATQLPTAGDVSATMPNYTDAVWKNKAELL